MEIRIGTFLKEINSTKAPDISSSTTQGFTNIEVQLKDNVSILSPIILIDRDTYDPSWNYCYIYIWNRFYFLHDAVITPGGVWEVQLGIDVLASWKSYILGSTAYVARSASNWSNYIPDSTWTHNMNIGQSTQEIDIGLNVETGGCFLLFLAGASSAGVGAIPSQSVFILNAIEVYRLVDTMFSNNFYDAITAGVTDPDVVAMGKLNFNPFEYVTKCLWLPFAVSDIGGTSGATMKFGWWDSGLTGKLLNYFNYRLSFTFDLGTYTSWKDRSGDWTKNELYIPGFPSMSLPCDIQGQTLTGTIDIDFATGEATLFIKSGNNLILTSNGKLGCEVQLSALYKDYVSNFSSVGGIISTGIKAIGKAGYGLGKALAGLWNVSKEFKQDPIGAIVSNAGNFVDNAVNGVQTALAPSMSTKGANGSRTEISRNPKAILTTSTYGQLADNHERLGGMCCQTLLLSTLSGYTEVVNPKIDAPCSSGESTMINSFMSGGFYIE